MIVDLTHREALALLNRTRRIGYPYTDLGVARVKLATALRASLPDRHAAPHPPSPMIGETRPAHDTRDDVVRTDWRDHQ